MLALPFGCLFGRSHVGPGEFVEQVAVDVAMPVNVDDTRKSSRIPNASGQTYGDPDRRVAFDDCPGGAGLAVSLTQDTPAGHS